ncbi:MAG: RNA polymerase sigma factor [Gemmatimonadota bacterium]|nr:RNA polymerase sigma factor [Gemmatimonadota bacterium]
MRKLLARPGLTRFAVNPGGDPDWHDVYHAMRGDTAAFERIFRSHATRMQSLSAKFLGPGMAEDAVQEIFIHAWERLGQFRGESLFSTWLHRLAVNVLLRQAERIRRIERRLTHVGLEEVHARTDQPALRLDIDSALATLGDEVRAVVVLHDLEGYAHNEIAQTLGISISASKMRLHRGRMELREHLLR